MNINYLKLYSALLETNRLLLKERNVNKIYNDFCKIVVESGEFSMAWVGVPDEVTIYFKIVAYYAKDENGLNYSKNIEVSYLEDIPLGRGMSGKAFRDKKPYIVNDFLEEPTMQPWRNQAKTAGFASAASFPIMYDDELYAVLSVYSTEVNYFNEDVVRLLSELATDIGFAIYNIKTENKLKQLEERWRIALENSNEGVWDWECKTGKIYYSKKWKEMLDYNEDEIKDSIDEFYKLLHPDDLEKHNFKQMECISGVTDSFENTIRLKMKNGKYKWILSRGKVVERDEHGSALRLLGVHIDISPFIESEEKILKVNRLYDTLFRTNQLIIKVKSHKNLFKNICNILIKNIDIELALVAIPKKDYSYFNVVSYAANNKNGLKYLKTLKISPLETIPEGKGAAGKAFRMKKYIIMSRDEPDFLLWRQAAIECNFNVVGYFPLLYKNHVYGVMGIYSSKIDYFDESIIKLMENLTADVAFALYRIALEKREQALKKDLVLSNNIYENSQEGIVLFDRYKNIISVNKTFEKLTGYKKNLIIKNKIKINKLISVLNGEFEAILDFVFEGNMWHNELYLNNRKNVKIPVYARIYSLKYNTKDIYILTALNISEKKELEQSLDFMQHFDTITGLPNRILLLERLNQAVAIGKRFSTKIAIIHIDIDNFKIINDNIGFSSGNALLHYFAKRLHSIVRETDTLARLSGDEFILMAVSLNNVEEALTIINKIRNALKEPIDVLGKRITLTASFGVSIYPDDSQNPIELLSFAESAVKMAKENGRNNYVFYSSEVNKSINKDFTFISGFADAIINDEFVLFYQPKVSFATGKIVGAEALIRWEHPQLGLIAPSAFIPLAEIYGYIGEIGAWVIRKVCKQIYEWKKKGINIDNVAINIAAQQFNDKELRNYINECARGKEIDPSLLEAELTESMIMRSIDTSLMVIKSLKELNIKLSLDDFGTGYSSLSYLTKIPLDTLKIDRSFVMNMTEGRLHDKNVVKMIIGLAKSLNFKVLAEGVETEEQYRILKEWGCDEYQGYYFSKPLPPDKFAELFVNINK